MKTKCRRIAIANGKGGVGKTTTVLETAAHAKSMGKKVLVVDMDPQHDATKMLLGGPLNLEDKHIFHVLVNNEPVENTVRESTKNWGGIHIIPSDINLTTLPEHISGKIGYEKILAKILDKLESHYDLIIIDTGPQTTVLTQLALRAASYLLIPTDTSVYSEDAIARTLSIKDQLEDEGGHKMELIGIVFAAHHKPNAKSNISAEQSISRQYGKKLLKLTLPHNVKVGDAQRKDPKTGETYFMPAMGLLAHDSPLYLNYRKITKLFLGEAK